MREDIHRNENHSDKRSAMIDIRSQVAFRITMIKLDVLGVSVLSLDLLVGEEMLSPFGVTFSSLRRLVR